MAKVKSAQSQTGQAQPEVKGQKPQSPQGGASLESLLSLLPDGMKAPLLEYLKAQEMRFKQLEANQEEIAKVLSAIAGKIIPQGEVAPNSPGQGASAFPPGNGGGNPMAQMFVQQMFQKLMGGGNVATGGIEGLAVQVKTLRDTYATLFPLSTSERMAEAITQGVLERVAKQVGVDIGAAIAQPAISGAKVV